MSSKLKVALSKVSRLPLLRELAARRPADDPRAIAGKFYLKTLPRMTTMPKVVDSIPKVNLWLWFIGYLRIQWPEVERNSSKLLGVNLPTKLQILIKEVCKYLPQKEAKVSPQNSGLVKSVTTGTSLASRTKKWGQQ